MFLGGQVNLTASQWMEIKDKFSNSCAYCHRETILTMDHIIPLSKGGEHTAENVLPACRPCNGKKGAKLLQQ
jgi:5-methylcytosine-specific restriction endonuclease McrA